MVYLNYTQTDLDAQYDNRRHVPNVRAIVESYGTLSDVARLSLPNRMDVPYGASSRERVDLFFPKGSYSSVPIAIFVHGGAWRRLSRRESAFPALTICPGGAVLVVAGFDLATQVSLDRMVHQIRSAVSWAYRHADEFGGDPQRIFLVAHSSGAHLAAMTAVEGWSKQEGLPGDLVKAAILISGVYDLEPVRLSYRNELLQLDLEAARRLSPILHVPRRGEQIAVLCAADDTPEFRRQSKALVDEWTAKGVGCTFSEIPLRNHYDIVLDLADSKSQLAHLCRHVIQTI